MVVTVTSLRLRRLSGFFKLSWQGFQITLQARKSPGFLKMKNTGFGHLHFTMSAWESAEAAQAFARSGTHLQAMKTAASLAQEVRIYTYSAETLPSWNEGKDLVLTRGRIYSY